MTTTTDPITFDAPDARAAYVAIAAAIGEFGFTAHVDVFPGGTFGVVITWPGRDLLLRGVEDGALVLMDETDAALVADAERMPLSLAECIARAIVNRLNVDDVPQPKA